MDANLTPGAAAVLSAWINPGPHPEYHRMAQANLHRDWPMLAAALEQLAAEAKAGGK